MKGPLFGPWRSGSPTAVMGVLNVTPDSFSDGGRFLTPERAIEHGLRLIEEGADLIDVGGESTRPGADSVAAEEEERRVVPVVQELARGGTVPVSVDTTKASVAAAALEAGAAIVNDVSGGLADERMLSVVAHHGACLILMHRRGTPKTMQIDPVYDDVVAEVREHLRTRAEVARQAGIHRHRIAVDPGIGFGKTVEHNLALLANLAELVDLGFPVVVGASRKSFLGRVLDRPIEERLEGSLTAAIAAASRGAAIVRVHDVRATVAALTVEGRIREAERR